MICLCPCPTKFRAKQSHFQNSILYIWQISICTAHHGDNDGTGECTWLIEFNNWTNNLAFGRRRCPTVPPSSQNPTPAWQAMSISFKEINHQEGGCSPKPRCTCKNYHRKLTLWQEPGPSCPKGSSHQGIVVLFSVDSLRRLPPRWTKSVGTPQPSTGRPSAHRPNSKISDFSQRCTGEWDRDPRTNFPVHR